MRSPKVRLYIRVRRPDGRHAYLDPATSGDMSVDSRNAADFYVALKKLGVPAELHIFELGPHGTHMGTDQPPAMRELTVFPTLLANWLQLHQKRALEMKFPWVNIFWFGLGAEPVS